MAETDFAQFEAKTSADRTVMHVLYAMHTIAWPSMGMLAVIALIINYIKRADENDSVYVSHHNYMIAHVLVDRAVAGRDFALVLLLFLPGMIAHTIVLLWYLYRCIRGWLRFNDGRLP